MCDNIINMSQLNKINLNIIVEDDEQREENKHEENMSYVPISVIVILDKSGSMVSMGEEPVQSINVFVDEQKLNSDDNATFTLVTFNDTSHVVIDHQPLSSVQPLLQKDYYPYGGTALNDAVCTTIENELESHEPNNKVLVIITDGYENSSREYSTWELKSMIKKVESEHDWKVVFMGANINAYDEGSNIGIRTDRCAQFNSDMPGDLLQLSRQTSTDINNYRRSRTLGNVDELILNPVPKSYSCPSFLKEEFINPFIDNNKIPVRSGNLSSIYKRSHLQSPMSIKSMGLKTMVDKSLPFGPLLLNRK